MSENKRLATPFSKSAVHIHTVKDFDGFSGDVKLASPVLFAQYVRTLRQNGRQGTVGCKDRSEVAFANRKPWKQKGTGRARAGSARSPLWRKGGVIFGPQPRVRTLGFSSSMKSLVMKSLFYEALQESRVLMLPQDIAIRGYAQEARAILSTLELQDRKVVLFVAHHDYETIMAFGNMPNVLLHLYDHPNAETLQDNAYWVYFAKDSELLKEMVQKWI